MSTGSLSCFSGCLYCAVEAVSFFLSPCQAGCPECLQSGASLPGWRAFYPPWTQLSQHLPALPGGLGELEARKNVYIAAASGWLQ